MAAAFFLFVLKEANSYLIVYFSRRFLTAMIQVRKCPIPYALWISRHGIIWLHPMTHKSWGIIKTDMIHNGDFIKDCT